MENHSLDIGRSRLAISHVAKVGTVMTVSQRGAEGSEGDQHAAIKLKIEALRWLEMVIQLQIELCMMEEAPPPCE